MPKFFYISRQNNDYRIAETPGAAAGHEKGACEAVDHRFAHMVLGIRLKEGETRRCVLVKHEKLERL